MKLMLAVTLIIMLSGYLSADSADVYCGRRLSNVLAVLCWDSTNMVKRDAGWWLPPTSVRALGGTRDKRDGVADECCSKLYYRRIDVLLLNINHWRSETDNIANEIIKHMNYYVILSFICSVLQYII